MVRGAQREELGHISLMVHLVEDMLICGTGSKRAEGVEAVVGWKRYTYILCFEWVVCTVGGCHV